MLSGLLHALAEFGGGMPLQRSGTMRFFIMQAIGITFEDIVRAVFRRISYRGMVERLLSYTIGYFWVASFLIWTTPGWFYPDASGPAKTPFRPFSIFEIKRLQ